MCTPTWISWVITADDSAIKPGEMYKNKMPKHRIAGGNHLVFMVVVVEHCKRGSQLS